MKYQRVKFETLSTVEDFIAEADRLRSFAGSDELVVIDDIGNQSPLVNKPNSI